MFRQINLRQNDERVKYDGGKKNASWAEASLKHRGNLITSELGMLLLLIQCWMNREILFLDRASLC